MSKKLKTDEITIDDINEYLNSQDDFQLEMSILKMCKQEGFETSHGGSYEDPITRKTRQFDIRSKITKDNLSIFLAIECKSLKKSFPLLICKLPRLENESYHDIVYSSDLTCPQHPISPNLYYNSIRVVGFETIYTPYDFVGKSTNQVGKDNSGKIISRDSELYDKWTQAVHSAFDLVKSTRYLHKEINRDEAFSVIIPTLVINDDTLWIANYSNDGSLAGEPIKSDSCAVYLGKNINTGAFGINYKFSHLHIYTKKGFNNFLLSVAKDTKLWESFFPPSKLKNS